VRARARGRQKLFPRGNYCGHVNAPMKEMTHVRNCAAMLHTGVSSFLFALPPSLAPSLPPPLSLSLSLLLCLFVVIKISLTSTIRSSGPSDRAAGSFRRKRRVSRNDKSFRVSPPVSATNERTDSLRSGERSLDSSVLGRKDGYDRKSLRPGGTGYTK